VNRTAPVCVLVGMMGAGKTTVGTALAGRLGVRFRDTDRDVELLAGRSIPDIFAVGGESRFRALERLAVAHALDTFDGVVALGGGAVLADETRAKLAGHTVVLLTVGVAEAAERVAGAGNRPLLAADPQPALRRLADARRDYYAAVATREVDTGGRPVTDVVDELAALLGSPDVPPAGHRRTISEWLPDTAG
jgi:shikimate kinase